MATVVVGGGITGLAAAYRLAESGAEVRVLEAGQRLGGKIRTRTIDGTRLDVGADAFVARRPEPVRLARDVGLGRELVAPTAGSVWLWRRGALHPFPEGTVFGVPAGLAAVVRGGVLSWRGAVRALLEPLLPRPDVQGPRSVGEVITTRFGREVTEVLVGPLLAGIHAGDVDRLDLRAAAPVAAAAGRGRSLMRGARAIRRERGDGPVFQTVRGGLDRLVSALAEPLADRIVTGARAVGLEPVAGGRWRVVTAADGAGGTSGVDDVVLAVPAPAAAALLEPTAPRAAELLDGVRYASVATVSLGYSRRDLPGIPRGSGLLVPRREGRLVKAVTWTSSKWGHRDDGDTFWMRASVGHVDDTAVLRLPDGVLEARVAAEVAEMMGISADPDVRAVTRWPDALPQYEVGHRERVARARTATPDGIHLAGAAYDGVGVASCIAGAEAVARAIAGR